MPQGLAASLGRDEYRVLWPLATEHHGSSYEGWATKRVAQEWTQDDVLLTLAYSTLPFPPGLSICCQDTTGSWPQFWIDEERMRVEGDDWIEKCLITLRVIVIGAFDNERLLFWVPDTEIGVSAGALAIRSGLTPIDDQLCGEQRVAELKHCGPIDFADERVVAVRVRFRGWD